MKIRVPLALALALALASCSGGTPSSPPVPHAGGTDLHAAPPNPARVLAGQALDVAYAANGAAALLQANQPGTFPIALIESVLSGHTSATEGCQNGVLVWGQNAGAETDYTIETFADPTCTELTAVWQLSAVASSATLATVNGTVTTYLDSMPIGALTLKASQTLVSGTEAKFDLQYQNATNGIQASTGFSCDLRLNGAGQYATACGFGQVVDATPPEQGATLSLNASENGTGISVNGKSTGFTGGAVSLMLKPGAFPDWTMEGGTATSAADATGQIGVATQNFTLTDSSSDASVAMQSTADVDVQGTITQISTGKTLATFAVMLSNGQGTVNYADGTSAPITGWTLIQ